MSGYAGKTPQERERLAREQGITHNQVLHAYAKWYYTVAKACSEFNDSLEFTISEDLGDWTESWGTMLTFGPNPRSFDPPIYPTREEADYMGRHEAIALDDTKEAT
jgi:hypothetical protein